MPTSVLSTFGGSFLEPQMAGNGLGEMNEQRILQELLTLLEAHDVAIRSEPLGGNGGGLCTIKGQMIFFVDTQAPSAEVAAMCAEAVVRLLDIETVYVRPEVREFIEKHSKQVS